MHVDVLFILKRKDFPYGDYGCDNDSGDKFCGSMQTGLLNSANFINEMLQNNGVFSELVVVHDNNDIDREVTKYRPSTVIIEALWVVPEKFDILQRLHPDVTWIVRLHSAIPFIANEGIAMKWILSYLEHPNVLVSTNDLRLLKELRVLADLKFSFFSGEEKILYQPNYYPPVFARKTFNRNSDSIDIGCFGAIRPMKNQLAQAIAAIRFADDLGKTLRFHINGDRIEMKGSPVLHNLIALFEHLSDQGHQLVMHDWCNHEDFLSVVSSMDIGMQVSYTETFNIVTADMITQGVPVVASTEVRCSSSMFSADPNSVDSMVKALKKTYRMPQLNVRLAKNRLRRYDNMSENVWLSQIA